MNASGLPVTAPATPTASGPRRAAASSVTGPARPQRITLFPPLLIALDAVSIIATLYLCRSLRHSGRRFPALRGPSVSSIYVACGIGTVVLAWVASYVAGALVLREEDRRGAEYGRGGILGGDGGRSDPVEGREAAAEWDGHGHGHGPGCLGGGAGKEAQDELVVGSDYDGPAGSGLADDGLTAPLLADKERTSARECSPGCAAGSTSRDVDEEDGPTEANRVGRSASRGCDEREPLDMDLDEAKELARVDHALTAWRESIFLIAYVVVTALSFALGIEAVHLAPGSKGENDGGASSEEMTIADVVYVALSLSTLQFSYFLTRSILTSAQTSPLTTVNLRAVHVHPIRFNVLRFDACCDICSEDIKGGQCFTCRVCDFDYCVDCYERGRKVQDWAVLRGDRGVKDVATSTAGGRRAGVATYLLRSLGLLRPHLPHVVLTASCLLANVVFRLFVPNVEGTIFDNLIEGDIDPFLRGVQFLAAYWAGQTVVQAVQRYAARLVSRRLRIDLRRRLFDRLLKQDVAFFDATRAGAMTRRVDGDVEDMSRPIPILVNSVLQGLLLMTGSITCCLLSSVRLTVLSAACLGPMTYLTYLSADWGGNLEGQMVACEEEGNAVISEAMTNIRNVRALSAEQVESGNYRKALMRLRGKMHREALGNMIVEILESLLGFLVEVLVLWKGGSAIVYGHTDALTIGQLIAFTRYWELFSEGLEKIQDVFSELAQAAGAAQRVFDLMDIEPDIPLDEGTELHRNNFEGNIAFDNVKFSYQSRPDKPVLDGFSLEVPAGGTCALVGRSGSGKTTLVHLLLRFYDPRQGQITINGIPLTDVNLKTFHDLIGFVSQDTKLSFGSVRDNLSYGLPWIPSDEEIKAAARAANCAEFIEEMDGGYDANLGEAGVRLSGGQRQRISIARAFLRRPCLLILDEATSHLDSESEAQVQEGINRLIRSTSGLDATSSGESSITQKPSCCTVIVIAHRLSTVKDADVIAVVDKGKVHEQGTHDELLAKGGIYAKLIAKQQERAAEILPEDGLLRLDEDVDKLFDTAMGKHDISSSESSSGGSSGSSDENDY